MICDNKRTETATLLFRFHSQKVHWINRLLYFSFVFFLSVLCQTIFFPRTLIEIDKQMFTQTNGIHTHISKDTITSSGFQSPQLCACRCDCRSHVNCIFCGIEIHCSETVVAATVYSFWSQVQIRWKLHRIDSIPFLNLSEKKINEKIYLWSQFDLCWFILTYHGLYTGKNASV